MLLVSCGNNKHIKPASYFSQHLNASSVATNPYVGKKSAEITIKQIGIIPLKKNSWTINSFYDNQKNILYILYSNGYLIKFDTENKSKIFDQRIFNAKAIGAGMTLGNDNYLYIMYGRTLYQVDTNGNLIKYIDLNGTGLTDPLVVNNKVHVMTASGILYILDNKNLRVLHKSNYDSSDLFSRYPNSIASVNNNMFLIADVYNNTYAIDDTGNVIRKYPGSKLDVIRYTKHGTDVKPIVSDDFIYLSHNTDGIKIFNKNLDIIKQKEILELSSWALYQESIFTINKGNQIARLSAKDLSINWLVNLDDPLLSNNKQFSSYSNIIKYKDNLIFTDTFGYLYIIDSFNGSIKTRAKIKQNIDKIILKGETLIGIGKHSIIYWQIKESI